MAILEGWYGMANTDKGHYFREGADAALCGKEVNERMTHQPTKYDDTLSNCKGCKTKLKSIRKKEGKTLTRPPASVW